jgi:hypothetical protein
LAAIGVLLARTVAVPDARPQQFESSGVVYEPVTCTP